MVEYFENLRGAFMIIGILGMAILCWLVEMVAFRTLPPDERAFKTVFIAYAIGSLVSGFFGVAERYYWEAWFFNAIPALLYWLWLRHTLRKKWAEEYDSDTFG